jgi:hypothetical protein
MLRNYLSRNDGMKKKIQKAGEKYINKGSAEIDSQDKQDRFLFLMDDKGKGGQYRRFKEPNFYNLSDFNNTSELLVDMSWISPAMSYANVDEEKI